MQIRQRWFAVLLLVAALLTSATSRSSAEGGALTLGSGLAFSILIPDNGDNLNVFSAPEGSGFLGVSTSPGLRLGHVSATRGFEFGVGVGAQYASSSGESAHMLTFGLDAQKHFVGKSSWNLFLGGELGLGTADFFGDDVTQPYFGAMVGGRNIISDDNGSMKIALHLRHHLDDEDAGADSYNEVAFAMHFDLWIP